MSPGRPLSFVTAPVVARGIFRNFTYLMTTQVLFIRHGETDWNRIKRIQGHIDIPLASSGMVQAGQLAQRLLRSRKPAPSSTPSIAAICCALSKRPNPLQMRLV